MFTSRAEYRLLLRHDNADRRLTPLGERIGLADRRRCAAFHAYAAEIDRALETLRRVRRQGQTLEEWLRRPETEWEHLCSYSSEAASLAISARARRQVVIETKYAGYIRMQEREIERHQKVQGVRIPEHFDYLAVPQLRMEAKEKLNRVKPRDMAQAGRISGITPADLAIVMLYLKQPGRIAV
jgi:tRNA uridine 5-carboxymethylaminomethyl modification enzyme